MSKVKFILGLQSIIIDSKLIPDQSLLKVLSKYSDVKNNIINVIIEDKNIFTVCKYLQSKNNVPIDDPELLKILDYYGAYRYDNYKLIYDDEKYIRLNMYSEKFSMHEMNTDLYYNLTLFDSNNVNKISINTDRHRDNLLFVDTTLNFQHTTNINKNLKKLDRLLIDKHMFIAGGSIFSVLFGTTKNDIDIFLFGIDKNQALNIITKFLITQSNKIKTITRTKNTITFSTNQNNYQFILKLYKSPSEIIHGFDIDCCCMGYDGKNICMTERCIYALYKGYNTVNLDLLSPSYEYRLVKYALRGLSIRVPNFNRNLVDNDEMKKIYCPNINNYIIGYSIKNKYNNINDNKKKSIKTENKELRCANGQINKYKDYYNNCKKTLRGLSLLLFLEEKFIISNDYEYINTLFEKLSLCKSDYMKHTSVSNNKSKFLQSISCIKNNSYNLFSLISNISYLEDYPSLLKQCFDYIDSYRNNSFNIEIDITCDVIYLIRINIINYDFSSFNFIINIQKKVYKLLDILFKMDIPKKIKFKTTNPGDEMTNTFHKIILENTNEWYNGRLYKLTF